MFNIRQFLSSRFKMAADDLNNKGLILLVLVPSTVTAESLLSKLPSLTHDENSHVRSELAGSGYKQL